MDNNLNVPNTSFENQNNNVNFNQQPINQNVSNNIPNNVGEPNKKNNTNLIILIIIVAIVGIVAAIVVPGLLKDDKKDKKDDKEVVENKNDKEEEKEEEDDSTKLHAFSEYKNYKFKMDMVMATDDMEIKTSSSGVADVTHGTDYMETVATIMGYSATTYSYSDYRNGYVYSSEDKVNWESEEATGTESINLDDIINKINSNSSDVTVLSDNHYSVKVDYESGDMAYDGVYADVYVTNGYISKLSYDLTSVVASEGFTKFTVDFQISDFNEAGDITIPENIKKDASSI